MAGCCSQACHIKIFYPKASFCFTQPLMAENPQSGFLLVYLSTVCVHLNKKKNSKPPLQQKEKISISSRQAAQQYPPHHQVCCTAAQSLAACSRQYIQTHTWRLLHVSYVASPANSDSYNIFKDKNTLQKLRIITFLETNSWNKIYQTFYNSISCQCAGCPSPMPRRTPRRIFVFCYFCPNTHETQVKQFG